MAGELIEALSQTPGVDAVTPAGSLRRGRETVGDLDLLVTGPDAVAALETFSHFPVDEVLARGENKASAKVGREGLQVDVRTLPPGTFGAAMQYFTGSKDHNVAIRTRAVKRGSSSANTASSAWKTTRASQAKPKPAFTRRWAWLGFPGATRKLRRNRSGGRTTLAGVSRT